LAREYSLTAYDATYLDLALRLNARLASFDRALLVANKRAGGQAF
jgi:predicted nucleic acid-binding protein